MSVKRGEPQLMWGCWAASTTVCSPAVTAAAAELGPIPGYNDPRERPEFVATLRGCSARFNSPLAEADLMNHYRDTAQAAGWQLHGEQSTKKATMSNATVTAEVVVPLLKDYGMYVMDVYPRAR